MFLVQPHTSVRRRRSRQEDPPRKVTGLRGSDWKYVAEGGANVLFRHHPTSASSDAFAGKLLRVKKCDMVESNDQKKKKPKRRSLPTYHPHYPHPAHVLTYANEEILPYLQQKKHQYVQVAELMEVETQFLVELNAQLMALESRPAHRRQSQIDLQLNCVMMLPDVTLPPPDDNPLLFFNHKVSTDQDEEDEEEETTEEEEEDAEIKSLLETMTVSSSQEEDDDEEEESSLSLRLLAASPPRSHRNIFDCCFRNLCVEIKPKIGFKPHGPLIPSIKKQVCRFCMHQHYKKRHHKVEELSEYCPLDLFSQDPTRIRTALRALQRTPQNNFKVFVRSNKDEVVNVVTGLSTDALPKGASQSHYAYCRRKRMGFRHSCQSIGAEEDLMMQEDDEEDFVVRSCEDDHVIPDIVELMTQVLMQLEILDDLKQMQLLDHLNVDGMWHLQTLLKRLEALSPQKSDRLHDLVMQLPQKPVDEDRQVAGSLRRCLAFVNDALACVEDMELIQNMETWEQLTMEMLQSLYFQLLQRFQVATTLKDCSLLLCLRRSDAKEPSRSFDHLREYEHTIQFRDMTFHCVVAVVDLDVKSHKSVDDYYRLDQKIVTSFQDSKSRQVCHE